MAKEQLKIITIKTEYEHIVTNYNSVVVHVVVDYARMTVSIVERNRDKKQFMFCWRSISYEGSRNNILDAMRNAMDIGFDRLKTRQKENEENCLDRLCRLAETEEVAAKKL